MKSRGFTLVEMIVATMLLVIGVAAALAAISSATSSTGIADEYTTAALLAQQRLAEIALQPDNLSGGGGQGDFGDAYPGFHWQQTNEPTDIANLVRVTLTIQWRSGLMQRSASFTTYELVPQQQ